jgi:hypothetical protein
MKSYHLRSVRQLTENGESVLKSDSNVKLVTEGNGSVAIAPEVAQPDQNPPPPFSARVSSSIAKIDVAKSGPRGLVVTVAEKDASGGIEGEGEDVAGYFLEFDSSGDRDLCQSDLVSLKKSFSTARSVFTDRTDEASATQYFQFYG